MPHFYLPTAHTDDDRRARRPDRRAVESAELYVTWTPAGGPAAAPCPSRSREPAPERMPALALLAGAVGELWARLRRPPGHADAPAIGAGASVAAAARGRPPAAATPPRPARPSAARLGARPPPRPRAAWRPPRPRLVELDAPLAVLALLEREPRAERAARAALEAR